MLVAMLNFAGLVSAKKLLELVARRDLRDVPVRGGGHAYPGPVQHDDPGCLYGRAVLRRGRGGVPQRPPPGSPQPATASTPTTRCHRSNRCRRWTRRPGASTVQDDTDEKEATDRERYVAVLGNPRAGQGRHRAELTAAVATLRRTGIEVRLLEADSAAAAAARLPGRGRGWRPGVGGRGRRRDGAPGHPGGRRHRRTAGGCCQPAPATTSPRQLGAGADLQQAAMKLWPRRSAPDRPERWIWPAHADATATTSGSPPFSPPASTRSSTNAVTGCAGRAAPAATTWRSWSNWPGCGPVATG